MSGRIAPNPAVNRTLCDKTAQRRFTSMLGVIFQGEKPCSVQIASQTESTKRTMESEPEPLSVLVLVRLGASPEREPEPRLVQLLG